MISCFLANNLNAQSTIGGFFYPGGSPRSGPRKPYFAATVVDARIQSNIFPVQMKFSLKGWVENTHSPTWCNTTELFNFYVIRIVPAPTTVSLCADQFIKRKNRFVFEKFQSFHFINEHLCINSRAYLRITKSEI